MVRRWLLLPVVALLLSGCDSGSPLRAAPAAVSASAAGSALAPAAAAPSTSLPEVTAPAHAKAGDIEWGNTLGWQSYQQGLALAKQSHKPMLVMVYADWCSKCRALVPVFERSDVRELVGKMVAVRQNQDDPAPWLSEIGANDNYVPRIIFLNSDGTPLRQVTSGHPRYPFFYMADKPETLLSSLKQALKI